MPSVSSVTAPSFAVIPFTFTSSKSSPNFQYPQSPKLFTKQNPKPLLQSNSHRRFMVKATVIEKETPEAERPDTFLRGGDGADGAASSVRVRFEKMIREAQDSVCNAIEAADGGGKFREDVWSRPGGGGGISRVLQDGDVWEKAGVNVCTKECLYIKKAI